ncbi:NAD-binding protein [Rickenella mellea]|uniref:3-oxoacyl-[acyl-carrier-protein] reductase n=1 Tax=Rickenella mellea TaxID=50990 RepID=A0A4Y7QBJ4_9AGAM|nr:NAD-binding protein [Rickenella mellea]
MSSHAETHGKLALITGCTGGIGKATAISLAKLGCNIAVHYLSENEGAEALVSNLLSLGVKASAFQADFSTYDAVRKLHADVVEKMGYPDILFNNSGVTGPMIGPKGNIQDITPEIFEETWRINTGSSFLLTQLCLPHMESEKYGRIIFCSSVAAGTGGVVGPHYASSKSAMHGLVHWIASRYAQDGITCNAIAPALIKDTNMMKDVSEDLKTRIPVGRFGKSDDIAPIVELFVLNSYMTNKIIVADGGMTPSAF